MNYTFHIILFLFKNMIKIKIELIKTYYTKYFGKNRSTNSIFLKYLIIPNIISPYFYF